MLHIIGGLMFLYNNDLAKLYGEVIFGCRARRAFTRGLAYVFPTGGKSPYSVTWTDAVDINNNFDA